MAKSIEIRSSARPDLHELIVEAATFVGQSAATFVLSAGIEKARQILLEKEEFEQAYRQQAS